MSYENLSEMFVSDIIIEYQGCCPVTFYETRNLIEGNILLLSEYKGKIYQFHNNVAFNKFKINPEKYAKQKIPVKTTTDQLLEDKRVNFQNTLNYLETNFGALITKGMLELSQNRIKYPNVDVKVKKQVLNI